MSELFDHNIKQRTFIAASPEKVFDTVVSADGLECVFHDRHDN